MAALIECTQDSLRCFLRLSDSRKRALYGIANNRKKEKRKKERKKERKRKKRKRERKKEKGDELT